MFDTLSDKLQNSIKKIGTKTKIEVTDLEEILNEIKITLLEADINFLVVKELLNNIRKKSIGQNILTGLNAQEQIIKIIRDELTTILGEEKVVLNSLNKATGTILMLGLQGSGKTTTTAKLAVKLRKENKRKPFLIAADVYRPAAIDQLITLAKTISVPIYYEKDNQDVIQIITSGLKKATEEQCNLILIDTAGRNQIDQVLMEELNKIVNTFSIDDKILVIDSMIGQESVTVAKGFNESIGVTSTIFTKMDSDTRAGSIISVRKITNIPIAYLGTGEETNAIEDFYPDRIASRILGMGDVLSLIEKAEQEFDQEDAQKMTDKMLAGKFDFYDYQKQLKMVKKLGGLQKIFSMLGAKKMQNMQTEDVEKTLKKVAIIIDSMTDKERKNPKLLLKSSSRKNRLANGSGVSITEVNTMMKNFEAARKMMKNMKNNKNMLKDFNF